MRARVKVESRGDDLLAKLISRAKGAEDAYVTIGIHQDAGSYTEGKDPPTVVEVALWNEFGTREIPSHPFLRQTFDENQGKINAWREEAIKHILFDGWTVERALEMIGFRVQQLVQNKIRSNMPPPNAPATVAAKQREGVPGRTLMDSTLLLRSVTYRVHVGGKGGEG